MSQRSIGLFTSISLIVTNMVGTGVFTSLGFQLEGLSSPFAILGLWLLGGLGALCGAAVYAELALVYPGSGGEYHLLGRIYHPMAGFLAGWLSATVGFAAPIALSAMAFGHYAARVLPGIHPATAACLGIGALALVHARGLREGAIAQSLLTLGSLLLIVLIITAGLRHHPPQPLDWTPSPQVFSAPFAVSLVWVFYAFTGWNAVSYVAGEIRHPRIHLPVSLLLGTSLVTALYVGLTLAFLRSTPAAEMRGALEVAHVAGGHLFGASGARLMSLVLCLALLGSVSGMLFAGSRIPAAMAEACRVWPALSRRSRAGSPTGSVLLQSGLALVMVLTGSFESILSLVGFTLGLCTSLCVAGLFVVRRRGLEVRGSYRCWGYPLTPLLFLALNLWMLVFTFHHRPLASTLGLAIVATGIPVYCWLHRRGAGFPQDAVEPVQAGAPCPNPSGDLPPSLQGAPMKALLLAFGLCLPALAQSDFAAREAKVLQWEARVAATQPPEAVMDAMGLKPGMVMGEVGAGQGRFTLHFARRVGPKGRVYANDILKDGLDFLDQRCRAHGITHVQTVLGTPEDPRFPEKGLDFIGMVWTYHMMEKPVDMLKRLASYLKPGARLAMVEPAPTEIEKEIQEAEARTGSKPADIHGVDRRTLAREAAQAGLALERVDDTLLKTDVVYVLRRPLK